MSTDYVKAYRNERMIHAHLKRQQREAVLANRAKRIAYADQPIRSVVGYQLINIGEFLSKAPSQVSSTIKNIASI